MENEKHQMSELEEVIRRQQHELAEGAALHQHISELEAAHGNTKSDLEASRHSISVANQEVALTQHELNTTKSQLSQHQERVEQQLTQIESLQVCFFFITNKYIKFF